MRKFCGIAIVVGVLLFLLGTSMKHEPEVGTYHKSIKIIREHGREEMFPI